MARAAKAATLGNATPATRWARKGSSVRGFSHTDIDMHKIDAGQATALKSVPILDAKTVEEENRFAVSPMTFSVIPAARRNHGKVVRPESSTVPPMTKDSKRRSPMGYARLVAAVATLPPAACKMLWNANAAQIAAAPNPATTPSSQLGRESRPRAVLPNSRSLM